MKQSSKRLISIVLALLFVIGALVVLFDLIEPAYQDAMTTKGNLEAAQQFLATETQAVTQAESIITSYRNDTATLETVDLALPTGPDIAGALAQFYGLAANSGLTVQGISISKPILQAVSQPAGSSTNILKPVGTISFQLAAIGSYEDLQAFLAGIETNVRMFDLKALSISSGGATKDLYNYSMTVVTYYQSQ